jgi:hypothetical protein
MKTWWIRKNYDGFNVVLTTEDGIRATNTVYLEPSAIAALVQFLRERVGYKI